MCMPAWIASGGSADGGAAFCAAVSRDGRLHTWGTAGDFYLAGTGRRPPPHCDGASEEAVEVGGGPGAAQWPAGASCDRVRTCQPPCACGAC